MSTVKTIEVASIDQRPVKTRYGDKSAWGVRGSDGSKIDFAFKRPDSLGVVVGGTYDIMVDTGKYGDELVKGSIPTKAGATIHAGAMVAAGGSISVSPSAAPWAPSVFPPATPRFPLDITDSGNIAIREIALQAAVRFWENRAIPATVDEKQQAEDVIKTAYVFADFISGQREAKAVEAFSPDSPE